MSDNESYRLQVRLNPEWEAAVRDAAAAAGQNPSEFARDSMLAQFPARVQKRLGEMRPGRPVVADAE